jgi:hypothetical protein
MTMVAIPDDKKLFAMNLKQFNHHSNEPLNNQKHIVPTIQRKTVLIGRGIRSAQDDAHC